jgi:hypothetical protein
VIQDNPDTTEWGLGSRDKADEPGAGRISTETTSPKIEPLRIDASLFTERGCTHAALGVLIDQGTPIALSLFSVVHRVSSCLHRRDHNLSCNHDGRWVGYTVTENLMYLLFWPIGAFGANSLFSLD